MSSAGVPQRAAREGRSTFQILFLVLFVSASAACGGWLAGIKNWLPAELSREPSKTKSEGDEHAGHDHGHAGHAEENSLELSAQARKNIGLKIGSVQLQDFERMITIPGIVEERPGRTMVEISAPMTGIVSRIYPTRGSAVSPGQTLIDIRVTHEELVQSQSDLLKTAEELDVVDREVKRLEAVAVNAIAGKSLLERQYEQQKAKAILKAQQQTLVLHGLSPEQVENIISTRVLLDRFQVRVPPPADSKISSDTQPIYQVQTLDVERGQHVAAGSRLLSLADHTLLYIAGNAFEKDVTEIQNAIDKGWDVSAIVDSDSAKAEMIRGLKIANLDSQIDPVSRTISVYMWLPNKVLRDSAAHDGARILQWKFKPGQRMQIRVPVEQWAGRIVLPIEAVAQEGADWFVFMPNGDHVDRRPVHIEYRDTLNVVVANDGSLFPGDAVCLSAAQQMQLALKNKAGGGIDPHAGHSH